MGNKIFLFYKLNLYIRSFSKEYSRKYYDLNKTIFFITYYTNSMLKHQACFYSINNLFLESLPKSYFLHKKLKQKQNLYHRSENKFSNVFYFAAI